MIFGSLAHDTDDNALKKEVFVLHVSFHDGFKDPIDPK